MPRTIAALLERGLQIVDQVASGQTASAEDTQYAYDTLTSLLAELSKRGIVALYIDPDDFQQEDIPDHLFNALARVLAEDMKPQFQGGSTDDAMRESQINVIRRLVSIGPSYDVVETEPF